MIRAATLVLLLLPTAARAESVAISTGDCRKLVQHVPDAGVNYQPGVDVHGNAVAPADLGGGYPITLPESVDIQIGIDLADRLGLKDARKNPGAQPSRRVGPFTGFAPLGTLSIRGNDAYWNGQRLVPQDEALLAEACKKGLSVLPTEKPAPPK